MIPFFFFQAEDGIRDLTVTGVQTCALPISRRDQRTDDGDKLPTIDHATLLRVGTHPAPARVRGARRRFTSEQPADGLAAWAQAASVPFCLAVCVAIRSMRAGDRQSYGSSRNSLDRKSTSPMRAGGKPESMIEETNAANSGADQPLSFDSSVCTKSKL